mgnify:CR=1 FL=1
MSKTETLRQSAAASNETRLERLASQIESVRQSRHQNAEELAATLEPLAQAMNDAAANFPVGTSEPEVLGLALAESMTVRVPRLAAGPARASWRQHCSWPSLRRVARAAGGSVAVGGEGQAQVFA